MVLVLLGILAAVAISKYYDLKSESEKAAAYAYAKKFVAEFNSETAQRMLEGKECSEAKRATLLAIGPGYMTPNSDGMIILTSHLETDEKTIIVGLDCSSGWCLRDEPVQVPGGIVVCNKP